MLGKNRLYCPICESVKVSMIRSYNGKHDLFRAMSLQQCQECHFSFAEPMPDEYALLSFNQGYFEQAHNGAVLDKISTAFFSSISKLRIQSIVQEIEFDSKTQLKVLEIGPGRGFFAENWMQRYPDTEYHAIETDSSCYAKLKSKGVKLFSDIDSVENDYELVVISHVLEHVNDPVNFISSVSSKLKKNGSLFIEVPCEDWRHKKLDEPHLLFFNKSSMQLLLEKSGYSIRKLSYYGVEIDKLVERNKWYELLMRVRVRLLLYGLVFPFSLNRKDMDCLNDKLERAVIYPYMAHLETDRPAWWLRAVAIKK